MSRYDMMIKQARALVEGERALVPDLANLAALIWESLPDINWAGYYTAVGEEELLLGPFQGKPACIHIPWGKGVCGAAAARRETVIVPDVHAFPGHIACDSASRSEVVCPILGKDGRVLGVLDIDSPTVGRFSARNGEVETLEAIAALAAEACDWE